MDKIMSLIQLVMAVFMLICLIIWGIAHLIMGTIGIIGFLVVCAVAQLIWVMVRQLYKEYKEESDK
ncbi:MAG: hypothetical protein IJZ22_06980 [Bacteroidaceae bacterium]|nr:hypothetical protein [Bacteroidaceae bacterium]